MLEIFKLANVANVGFCVVARIFLGRAGGVSG